MPLDEVKIDNNCSKERRAVIKQEMENLMKQLALKIHNKETNEELCRVEGSWLRIQLLRIYFNEGLSEQAKKSKGDKILHDVFKRPERSYFQLLHSELEKLKQIGEIKEEDIKVADEESDEEEEPEQLEDGEISDHDGQRTQLKLKELMLKEVELATKEQQLKKYSELLKSKKKQLKRREQRLKEKEQEVKERELQLNAREQNLEHRFNISSPDLKRVSFTVRPTYPASPPVPLVPDPFGSEEVLNSSHPSMIPVPRGNSDQEIYDVVEDEEEEEIEIAMAASFARMSVDAKTPSRRSTVEEVDLICRIFPEPVAVEFLEACCKLKNSFENASMNDIEPGVVDIVFKAHLAYLKAVHDNSIPSQIRDEFQQADEVEKSKQYADGGILLSFNNLHHLLQMLSSQVLSVTSGRKQNEHLPYIMGVLMPEFLTRMVMSVYKINKDKATTKIKELSVHLSSILFDV